MFAEDDAAALENDKLQAFQIDQEESRIRITKLQYQLHKSKAKLMMAGEETCHLQKAAGERAGDGRVNVRPPSASTNYDVVLPIWDMDE